MKILLTLLFLLPSLALADNPHELAQKMLDHQIRENARLLSEGKPDSLHFIIDVMQVYGEHFLPLKTKETLDDSLRQIFLRGDRAQAQIHPYVVFLPPVNPDGIPENFNKDQDLEDRLKVRTVKLNVTYADSYTALLAFVGTLRVVEYYCDVKCAGEKDITKCMDECLKEGKLKAVYQAFISGTPTLQNHLDTYLDYQAIDSREVNRWVREGVRDLPDHDTKVLHIIRRYRLMLEEKLERPDIPPCNDLLTHYKEKQHPYVTDPENYFYPLVQKDPCLLEQMQKMSAEVPESQWMKDLQLVAGAGIYASLTLPLMQVMLPLILTMGPKVLSDAAIGAAVDAGMQTLFYYYFEMEEGKRDWDEAARHIDPWQVSASALESMYDSWITSAALSCLDDGFLENGKFKDDFETQECLKGAMISLITDGILNAGPTYKKLKKLAKDNPDRFLSGLFFMLQKQIENGAIPFQRVIDFCNHFNISSKKVRRFYRRFDEFIEAWYTSAGEKYVTLATQQANDLIHVSLYTTSYYSSYVAKKIKSGTTLEKLAEKAHFDELLAKLPEKEGINPADLTKEEYDQLLDLFKVIWKQKPKAKPEELADNFDQLTNHFTHQQLKPWLDKGIDSYKLQHLFENLLVDAADGKTQVAAILNNWPSHYIQTLFDDLTDEHFTNFIRDKPSLINSWKLVRESISLTTSFAKDKEVLQALDNILMDQDAVNAFNNGKIGGIEKFLKVYKDVRCNSCPETGGFNKHMPTLDEILNNTAHCLKEFKDKIPPELLGREVMTSTFQGRDGIQHMFRHMKEKGYKYDEIASIDGKFDGSKNAFDVKFVDGQSLKYIEYKSYLPENFGKTEHIKQFKQYLKEIDDLSQLNYVFNGSKADMNSLKEKFKNVFSNNAENIWKLNPQLFMNKKISLGKRELTLSKWQDLRDVASHNDFAQSNILNFIKIN